MGNWNCMRKSQKKEVSSVFCAVNNPIVSTSFTTPSMCDSHSVVISQQGSSKSASSDSFSWGRMQTLILEQEHYTQEVLTPPILKVAAQVMDALKRNIKTICDDYQDGSAQVPDTIMERFMVYSPDSNPANFSQTPSTISRTSVTKKMIVHFVTSLFIQDMILNRFVKGQNEQALALLKQVAVSHALMGVTPSEFRMMDWSLVHYVTKNKVVNEENINTFVVYLNILSNYISQFYVSQSVRQKMVDELTIEKKDDRNNKARENYRLMKKWKKHIIEGFADQDKIVGNLLNHLNRSKKSLQQQESVDTIILKQNDFIMKHFMGKSKLHSTETNENLENLLEKSYH